MSEQGKVNKKLLVGFLTVILLFSVVGYVFSEANNRHNSYVLDVSIVPEGVKLSPNESKVFKAYVENAVSQCHYVWKVNGTEALTSDYYSCSVDGNELTFVFLKVCDYVLIEVDVSDGNGGVGYASTIVYDPFSARSIYLDDLPIVYDRTVRFDGSYYYSIENNGNIDSDSNSSTRDVTVQDALTDLTSSGGTICLSNVSFNTSLTIPDDVTVYEVLNNGTKCYINSADSEGSPYTISTDGTNYFAQDSQNRYIASWESTNFGTILSNTASNGGKTCLTSGTFDLTTSAINLNITGAPLELIGVGENTIIQFTGVGYALTFTEALGGAYPYLKLSNFKLDLVDAVESGRNGINITRVGRNAYIEEIMIDGGDTGLLIYDTNTVFVDGIKIINSINGIKTVGGGESAANAIYISNFKITTIQDYGLWLGGGNNNHIENGVIEDVGVGIYADTPNMVTNIESVTFEGSTTTDIYLEGTDGNYPVRATNIDSCYFNSEIDYAITVDYGDTIKISNCRSLNHVAFVWLKNAERSLILENNRVEDSYYVTGETSGGASRRIMGTVIEAKRIGVIIQTASTVSAGDVVKRGSSCTVSLTTTQGDNNTCIVMYGGNATLPCIIAISGVTSVACNETVSSGDTLVSDSTSTWAHVDNTETDSKKVIGYAWTSKAAGAGTVLAKIP